jgi:O-methyltransferase
MLHRVPGLRRAVKRVLPAGVRARLPWEEFQRRRAAHVGTADLDEAYGEVWARVRPHTLTTKERIAALCSAVEYVVEHDVPGALVESGVWKDSSLMAALLRLRGLGVEDREVFGFDTFGAMPEPSEADVDFEGTPARLGWDPESPVAAGRSAEAVRATLLSTGYDPKHVHLVEGRVEDTIPEQAPERIAVLRLDTDWYASTRHELEHLYPRLSVGGVLMVDDYGHYEGARRATDEYFRATRILLHRIDYSARIAVKQEAGAGGTPTG